MALPKRLRERQEAIFEILKTLRADYDVRALGHHETPLHTIRIDHRKKYHHAFGVRLRWIRDHYVGYVESGKNESTAAVLAIKTPRDATQFVAAYILLGKLRAKTPQG